MENKKEYKSKQSAVNALWRWADRNIAGRPLVGDNGTTLQWCDNGRTYVAHVSRDYVGADWVLTTPEI